MSDCFPRPALLLLFVFAESAGARGGELCTPRASSMPVAPYVSPARTPDPRHGDLHTSMDMVEVPDCTSRHRVINFVTSGS